MKNAMQKDFWREIQHTRSRFFSMMILVALSVAFLSGLKATAPDMKKTGDDYLDSLHLADIQVLSTLGLTDEDIEAIRARENIEDAEGEYVIDAFASSDSLDAVVKVLSLTGRGINEVLLRGGRMPERADECVVEENMLSLMNIEIGDRITLTPGDDLSDALSQNTYTVVGTVRSPVYLAVERGTSTLGSGTVKAYLYLPREAFTLDYYTAAYVRVSGAAEMTAFYSDYDNYIDAVIDELEPYYGSDLPARYAEMNAMYESACLMRAQELTALGRPLDALPILRRIEDNKTAKKRLEAYVYQIIGRWKDTRGTEYIFREDGSCRIAGEEGYFGGSGYEITVGSEPYPTTGAYSVVSVRGSTVTLRGLQSGKTIRLSYLGEATAKEETADNPEN